MSIRWSEDEYRAYLAKIKAPDSATVSAAVIKPAIKDARPRKDPDNKIHSRVRIHYHSKRRRLLDPDRIYSCPATDGLRKGGILVDDTLEYVEAVTNSQEKSRTEETIIEVYEV